MDSTVYRGVLISGGWNRGILLYTEMSSFQWVGIEGFHCIEVSSFRNLSTISPDLWSLVERNVINYYKLATPNYVIDNVNHDQETLELANSVGKHTRSTGWAVSRDNCHSCG